MPRDLAELRELIRERSPLPAEQTELVIGKLFSSVPRRLAFALERWPLEDAAVLDVGSSYGHCLAHFGPGSVGVDISEEFAAFCRAIGLDVRLLDVDSGLDELPDASFDYIWVSDILEHLDAPRLALRRLAPKLRDDGRLILFVTTLPRNPAVRALLRRRGVAPFDAQVHLYQFSVETAQYLLKRTGYRVEEVAPAIPTGNRLLQAVSGPFAAQAPRVYIVARPDATLDDQVRHAENRNKPGRGSD